MAPILNVSAYRFVPIDAPHALRWPLLGQARACRLKGTILLAEEGINLFLAGLPAHVQVFLDYLRADARFAGLEAKESWSETQPFGRLLVKVKREIIRMDSPTVRPADERAPAVDATTLRRWLDQGHDDNGRLLALLDTRNRFEVQAGTFDGAIDWGLHKFSEFPAAVAAHRDELAGKTVVSFCTGGIRCEKAAIVLRQAGLEQVYQLEGGVLKYFELTDGAPHWHGRCFVFDEREELDPALAPAAR